jgi:hypothetical protein
VGALMSARDMAMPQLGHNSIGRRFESMSMSGGYIVGGKTASVIVRTAVPNDDARNPALRESHDDASMTPDRH